MADIGRGVDGAITHSTSNIYPGDHHVLVMLRRWWYQIAVRFTNVTTLLVHSGLDRFDIRSTRTDCKSAQTSAQVLHGITPENCHVLSTPLSVLQRLCNLLQ